jgi:hypothetical protein
LVRRAMCETRRPALIGVVVSDLVTFARGLDRRLIIVPRADMFSSANRPTAGVGEVVIRRALRRAIQGAFASERWGSVRKESRLIMMKIQKISSLARHPVGHRVGGGVRTMFGTAPHADTLLVGASWSGQACRPDTRGIESPRRTISHKGLWGSLTVGRTSASKTFFA